MELKYQKNMIIYMNLKKSNIPTDIQLMINNDEIGLIY